MKNRIVLPAAALSAVLLLAACSEPQQAQPAAAPAPAPGPAPDATASADASFGAAAPVELNYDQRRVALLPAKECNLERANGTVFSGAPVQVATGTPLRLSGWVANVAAGKVPQDATLRFVGNASSRVWQVPLHPDTKRNDVKALLGGDEAYAAAGYAVVVDTSRLPAGSYRVYTVFPAEAGTMACDNGRAIVVQ